MSILGRDPWVNKVTSLVLYGAAGLVMVFNIEFSRRYLISAFGNADSEFAYWASWIVAIGMSAYEGAMIAPISTPAFYPFLFSMPGKLSRMEPESKRKMITLGIFAFCIVVGILGFFCYALDWTSTAGGSGIENKTVRRFFTAFFVFGPELFVCLASLCNWLAKFGAADTIALKAAMDMEIEDQKRYRDNVRDYERNGQANRTARKGGGM